MSWPKKTLPGLAGTWRLLTQSQKRGINRIYHWGITASKTVNSMAVPSIAPRPSDDRHLRHRCDNWTFKALADRCWPSAGDVDLSKDEVLKIYLYYLILHLKIHLSQRYFWYDIVHTTPHFYPVEISAIEWSRLNGTIGKGFTKGFADCSTSKRPSDVWIQIMILFQRLRSTTKNHCEHLWTTKASSLRKQLSRERICKDPSQSAAYNGHFPWHETREVSAQTDRNQFAMIRKASNQSWLVSNNTFYSFFRTHQDNDRQQRAEGVST